MHLTLTNMRRTSQMKADGKLEVIATRQLTEHFPLNKWVKCFLGVSGTIITA